MLQKGAQIPEIQPEAPAGGARARIYPKSMFVPLERKPH